MVHRRLRRQLGVVVQGEQLHREGRVVGQHPRRIVVDVESVRHRLHHNAAGAVRHHPVELGRGQTGGIGRVGDAGLRQQRPGLRQRGAASQQPRDQLELGHVLPAILRPPVHRVAHEVQTGDAQPLFVDGVVVQGEAVLHMGHADHGVVRLHDRAVAQRQRPVPGRDDHALPEGLLIVQIAPEIKMLCLICGRRTHGAASFVFSQYAPRRGKNSPSGAFSYIRLSFSSTACTAA